MIFAVLVLRTSPPRPHSQDLPLVPVLEAGVTGLLSEPSSLHDGDCRLAVCLFSTSLNMVSTSPRVSVPWRLAMEANECAGVDNDNSIIVIIMATTEL